MSTLRFIVAGSLVALCASSFAQTPSRDDRMAQALQDYRAKPAATSPTMPSHHSMQHKTGMKHHGKMHAHPSAKAPVGKKSASDMTKG